MKPFLKWSGGKQRVLKELSRHFPTEFGVYYEPFLGSGSIFFHLSPKEAVLSDVNYEIFNVFRCVQRDPERLIDTLKIFIYDKNLYYHVRQMKFRDAFVRAAKFIYLNKTSYNGLYRVNKSGEFNVPMGRYKNPTICDEHLLRAASDILRSIDIRHGSYERIEPFDGDFVYLDPPYLGRFDGYTPYGFGEEDHRLLAECVNQWVADGVQVLMSQGDDPVIRELYGGYEIIELSVYRSIGKNRGKQLELLIKTYD